MQSSVFATVTVAGNNSGPIALSQVFNFSVQGTFTGQVNLERYLNSTNGWEITDTFLAAESGFGYEPSKEKVLYRLNVPTLTAGSVRLLLGQ